MHLERCIIIIIQKMISLTPNSFSIDRMRKFQHTSMIVISPGSLTDRQPHIINVSINLLAFLRQPSLIRMAPIKSSRIKHLGQCGFKIHYRISLSSNHLHFMIASIVTIHLSFIFYFCASSIFKTYYFKFFKFSIGLSFQTVLDCLLAMLLRQYAFLKKNKKALTLSIILKNDFLITKSIKGIKKVSHISLYNILTVKLMFVITTS